MDLGQFTEKLMGMDDAAWDRHTNPVSGWTRIASLPLLTLAIWSRVWIGWWSLVPVVLCLIWIWVNPRLFAKPASTDNWMSQGVLGERIWLARKSTPIPDHHDRVAKILNGFALTGLGIYVYGLWALHIWACLFGLACVVLLKMWFLDRMVWLYHDTESA